jgi:hypothetical protein
LIGWSFLPPNHFTTIAPKLDKDIQNHAILTDGTPGITLHALDPDEHLVEVRLVSGPWPTTPQTIGEMRTDFLAPLPYRLTRYVNVTVGQDQLNIPQAKTEYVGQPDGMADHLGREPMSRRLPASCRQSRLPPGHRPGPLP